MLIFEDRHLEAFVGFVVPVARGDKPGQQPVRVELIRVSYPPGVEPTIVSKYQKSKPVRRVQNLDRCR